jgi:cell division protein FtsW
MDGAYDRSTQAQRLDDLGGRYDPWLLSAAAALAALGVVMVASSSMPYALGNGVGAFHYFDRHLLYLGMGIVLAAVAMRTELKRVEQHSHLLLVLCFVLLIAVWVPGIGRSVNGSRRWLTLGVANFQVVEAVKLMLIVWLSSYLVRHRDQIGHRWRTLIKPLGVASLIMALLLVQPDFGSALLLMAITVSLLWLGGARIRNLALLGGIGFVAMSAIAFQEPYRVKRLTSFLNPWADQFDSGFQLVQAFIAIGRGDWTGVGLGGSILKLDYLPEAHTDFIFSVLAEELGFFGVICVIGLFALVSWRAFDIGRRCVNLRRLFSGYCAFGVGLWISLQSLVSMGVNLGVLPTKGLTLPLVSSGGSSVLMTCAALGLLLRVSYELERAERQVARRIDAGREAAVADDTEEAPAPTARLVRPAATGTPAAAASWGRGRVEPRLGATR